MMEQILMALGFNPFARFWIKEERFRALTIDPTTARKTRGVYILVVSDLCVRVGVTRRRFSKRLGDYRGGVNAHFRHRERGVPVRSDTPTREFYQWRELLAEGVIGIAWGRTEQEQDSRLIEEADLIRRFNPRLNWRR
jgi:hypothetical protein